MIWFLKGGLCCLVIFGRRVVVGGFFCLIFANVNGDINWVLRSCLFFGFVGVVSVIDQIADILSYACPGLASFSDPTSIPK